jgi:hypothetical protein
MLYENEKNKLNELENDRLINNNGIRVVKWAELSGWPINPIVLHGAGLQKKFGPYRAGPPRPIFFMGHHGWPHGLLGLPLKELK